MKYLTQNGKIKKTGLKRGLRLFNFGIPAYQSASGFKTCPNAAACAVGCYARSGAYLFSNVARAFEARLEGLQSVNFEADVMAELIEARVDVLRVHDSGDFFSAAYFLRWRAVMLAMPHVRFYAYTKQVSLFKGLKKRGLMPENFTVIFSYGGKEDRLISPATDRHALVFETMAALKAAGYQDTTEDDLNAIGENAKIGLVYHGTKNYNNTAWDKVPALRKVG